MKDFSLLAMPMTKLTPKGTKFVWTKSYEQAFQQLKAQLTSTPILIILEQELEYTLYFDASHEGLGRVLRQEGKVVA